jgi:hypothetical protein
VVADVDWVLDVELVVVWVLLDGTAGRAACPGLGDAVAPRALGRPVFRPFIDGPGAGVTAIAGVGVGDSRVWICVCIGIGICELDVVAVLVAVAVVIESIG